MRKNILYMICYEILILIIPLITTPYISRVLGAEGVGIYAYSFSLVSYFIIITQLGVNLYGKRQIAQVSDDKENRSKTFLEIFAVEVFMFLISFSTYFLYVFCIVKEERVKVALIIQALTLISGLFDISWFYFGIEKFKITVTRNIIVKVLSLILIFIFVKETTDVYKYVFIMSLSFILSSLVLWINIKKHVNFVRINLFNCKKRLYPMLKLFIPVLSTQLFSIVDKTFIGIFMNVEHVGYYENAYKIARVPVSITTAIGTVMLPRMTNLVSKGYLEESKRNIERSLLITMSLSYALAFGLFSISNNFIPIFLGSSFDESISILQILSFILIFISWGNVFRTQYILPNNMDNLYTKTIIYASLINIILNILIIPLYGTVGAALASLVSEALICLYQSYKIRKSFSMMVYFKKSTKYLFAAVFMSMLVTTIYNMMGNGVATLLIQISIGIIVFFLVSIVMEFVTKDRLILDEISLLKKILNNHVE